MRDSLVAAAEAYAKANPSPTPSPSPAASPPRSPAPARPTAAAPSVSPSPTPLPECAKDENSSECKIAKNLQEIQKLDLPIGWVDSGDDKYRRRPGSDLGGWWKQWCWHWPGWLITALAISFGAPFWFDLLNKFIAVRSAVKPHEKIPEERIEAVNQ